MKKILAQQKSKCNNNNNGNLAHLSLLELI